MLYPSFEKFYVAVDCVIIGYDARGLHVITLPRQWEPYTGMNSLPNSFVGSTESADEAASRVIQYVTGISNTYQKQLEVFSAPKRDKAGRVVSVAFCALVLKDQCNAQIMENAKARWLPLAKTSDMVFDHCDMIHLAMQRLADSIKSQPISFELLPPKFTLTQLQSLYECILGHELDKRNFRKRIQQMEILTKLEEKDKSTSRRGAFLYRYNPEKYERLLQKGQIFSLY